MPDFRFTLFNDCTLLVAALTIAMFFQTRSAARWPLAYYAVALGYALGFQYSLSPYLVSAGIAASAARRLWPRQKLLLSWAETVALAYVVWRCVELLLGR